MSPRSSRDGLRFDTSYSVDCARCGLIGVCPKYDIGPTIDRHYTAEHPSEQILIEGIHFTSYVSPLRCDTCSAVVELPYWTHVSTPPTSVDGMVDGDGLWLICDTCHNLWAQRDLVGLVRRHWGMVKQQTPGMDRRDVEVEVKASVAKRYRLLFERWDAGTRNTTEDPGPVTA